MDNLAGRVWLDCAGNMRNGRVGRGNDEHTDAMSGVVRSIAMMDELDRPPDPDKCETK